MNCYENVFIVRQELTPAQVQTLADTYSKLVADEGGEVTKTEYCGLRQLAYPIKKNGNGHYVLINIKSKPSAIAELERRMRLSEDVIRFLTISVEELDPNPSILTQQTRQKEGYSAGKIGHSRSKKVEDVEVDTTIVEEEEKEQ